MTLTGSRAIWLLVVPAAVLLAGAIVERSDAFRALREQVRTRSIPEGMLRLGETGKMARLFEVKSRRGVELEGIDRGLDPEQMPSSLLVDPVERAGDLPLLSIVADEDDLYDPQTGVLARPFKRGMKWERPGYVTFFEDGAIRFGSAVGLRVHGGKSRGHPLKSFRLYFREMYGADRFGPDVLFDGQADPITTLVVHNDLREHRRDPQQLAWRFMNPLAYDIAERIGCLAPRTLPARLLVNGEYQGPYVLTEHVGEQYLLNALGSSEFTLARTRHDAGSEPFRAGDREAYEAFVRWPAEAEPPLSLERAEARVDLDNLSRWFLSVLYCGTTDPFQGPLVRDDSRPEGRWFWINWDMDHSFMDYYRRAPEPWDIDIFEEVLLSGRRRAKPRGILLDRLRREAPGFRDYFLRLFTDELNHRLTREYVHSRIDHYEDLARAFEIEDRRFIDRLRTYADRRHEVLREQIQRYFDSGPAYPCRIDGASRLDIDGFRHGPGYEGLYFADTPALVEVPEADRSAFSHWRVNGEVVRTEEPALRITIERATLVEAVFAEDLAAASWHVPCRSVPGRLGPA